MQTSSNNSWLFKNHFLKGRKNLKNLKIKKNYYFFFFLVEFKISLAQILKRLLLPRNKKCSVHQATGEYSQLEDLLWEIPYNIVSLDYCKNRLLTNLRLFKSMAGTIKMIPATGPQWHMCWQSFSPLQSLLITSNTIFFIIALSIFLQTLTHPPLQDCDIIYGQYLSKISCVVSISSKARHN